MKVISATAYYQDFCFGSAMITHSTGSKYSDISNDWWFSNSTEAAAWKTTSNSDDQRSTLSDIIANGTFTSIGSGSTGGRWNRATATGSTYTGAADGVADPGSSNWGGQYDETENGPGNSNEEVLSQSSSTYYIYTETSSPVQQNDYIWLKSPMLDWDLQGNSGDLGFHISYHAATHPTSGYLNSTDEKFLTFFYVEAE